MPAEGRGLEVTPPQFPSPLEGMESPQPFLWSCLGEPGMRVQQWAVQTAAIMSEDTGAIARLGGHPV